MNNWAGNLKRDLPAFFFSLLFVVKLGHTRVLLGGLTEMFFCAIVLGYVFGLKRQENGKSGGLICNKSIRYGKQIGDRY